MAREIQVTLYNSVNQQIIGIFKNPTIAGRYLYPHKLHRRCNIFQALKNKGKILKSRFDFSVAVRYASDIHLEMLGDEKYKIINDYPPMSEKQAQGYVDSRSMLAVKQLKDGNTMKEKVIDGVLYYRYSTNTEWVPFTPEQLTNKILKLRQQVKNISQ